MYSIEWGIMYVDTFLREGIRKADQHHQRLLGHVDHGIEIRKCESSFDYQPNPWERTRRIDARTDWSICRTLHRLVLLYQTNISVFSQLGWFLWHASLEERSDERAFMNNRSQLWLSFIQGDFIEIPILSFIEKDRTISWSRVSSYARFNNICHDLLKLSILRCGHEVREASTTQIILILILHKPKVSVGPYNIKRSKFESWARFGYRRKWRSSRLMRK